MGRVIRGFKPYTCYRGNPANYLTWVCDRYGHVAESHEWLLTGDELGNL